MTRQVLGLLLFSNTLVLLLCAYYTFTGNVLETDPSASGVRFSLGNGPRLLAMLPFCFTFFYLLFLLVKTNQEPTAPNTLDAPDSDQ